MNQGNVLQSNKIQTIIDNLSRKVVEESKRKEGEVRDVNFDDTVTPETIRPAKTFLKDPVVGGRFHGYVNPITGNGRGPQQSPSVEATL